MSKNKNIKLGSENSLNGARWRSNKRLEFIDFRLQWDGQINRSDLTGFFGISVPQASLDIAKYKELASNNLSYDRRQKVYIKTGSFKAVFASTDPEYYLSELLSLKGNVLDRDRGFINWKPEYDVVPIPKRKVPSTILFVVLNAISKKIVIDVMYLSKRTLEPTSRRLSPHAIAHDGMRWHVRAYCYRRKEFRDFVIARFLKVELTNELGMSSCKDTGWNNILSLELSPNPNLPIPHQKVVELEYDMSEGVVEFSCREALLYYVLRILGLPLSQDMSSLDQQVVLKNHSDLVSYIS